MKKEEFYHHLAELLELDDDIQITEETNLREFDEFDSLAIMSIIAFTDRYFGVKIAGDTFQKITTVDSLMDVIGRAHFE